MFLMAVCYIICFKKIFNIFKKYNSKMFVLDYGGEKVILLSIILAPIL